MARVATTVADATVEVAAAVEVVEVIALAIVEVIAVAIVVAIGNVVAPNVTMFASRFQTLHGLCASRISKTS
jgi:hypothetical protein